MKAVGPRQTACRLLPVQIPANMVTDVNEHDDDDDGDVDDADDDDDDDDDDDGDDDYGDENVGAGNDGNSWAVAADISINAEYGNIISTMHYNNDTTMQATFFIYTGSRSRAKVNATRSRPL